MTKYRDGRDLPADDDKSDAITRHCDRRLSQQLASETDYERHVARRRCRLMTATEDAFAVIQRMNSSHKGVWRGFVKRFDWVLNVSADWLVLFAYGAIQMQFQLEKKLHWC